MKLTILPSDKGDCMFFESPDGTTILIDGGMKDSYLSHVRPFLGDWNAAEAGRQIDLVYVSHIDQDHIAGVLQLMNDIAEWRVYDHKVASKPGLKKPAFDRPPEVARVWHNSFRDLITANTGAIESTLAASARENLAAELVSMLAAGAAQLSNSTDMASLRLADEYRSIANSIPEAIKLSARVSADQLKIKLNGEFDGKLAMVRDTPDKIRLNGAKSPLIRVIGPFAADLEKLRTEWNAWLRDVKNKNNLAGTRRWREDENDTLDFSSGVFFASDGLGKRSKVTAPNLASLMLSIEQDGKQILLTGDGHSDDIIAGLEHNGLLKPGKGLHVDVLKIQHHGSEHNLDQDFVRRITADHYVICGNGRHENPDLRVLDALMTSRLGPAANKSDNPEAGKSFTVWFNCSTSFLNTQIKAIGSNKEYAAARDHFDKIESKMKGYAQASPGSFQVKYLKKAPLVLAL